MASPNGILTVHKDITLKLQNEKRYLMIIFVQTNFLQFSDLERNVAFIKIFYPKFLWYKQRFKP